MPIPSDWQFGPFAPDLDAGERVARLRTMRAVVTLTCGPRGAAAEQALRVAETDLGAEVHAVEALARMAALDRRHVLASYHRVADPR